LRNEEHLAGCNDMVLHIPVLSDPDHTLQAQYGPSAAVAIGPPELAGAELHLRLRVLALQYRACRSKCPDRLRTHNRSCHCLPPSALRVMSPLCTGDERNNRARAAGLYL
jgi:hypothetical protein